MGAAADPQPQSGDAAASARGRRGLVPASGMVVEPGAGARLGAGRAALRPAAGRGPPGGASPSQPGDPAVAAHALPRRPGRRLPGGDHGRRSDEPPAARAWRRLGRASRRCAGAGARDRGSPGGDAAYCGLAAGSGGAAGGVPLGAGAGTAAAFLPQAAVRAHQGALRTPAGECSAARPCRLPAAPAPPAPRRGPVVAVRACESPEIARDGPRAPAAMTVPRQVSVAILSWNGRHHLETCLEALSQQHDPGVDWDVLVLDNGSTDGTGAWLRARYPEGRLASPPASPRLRVLESPVNLGFCAGNNRLVAAASGDVAFLNNDTRPDRGWLAALVRALAGAPSDVAAVSGKIVDWDGERLDFGRGVMTFDGHAFQLDFRRPLGSARVPARGEELLFACGGNMLIRRASFLAVGGFDESYFAYLEDVDLGWRLWSGGERVVFEPARVVAHPSNAHP